MRNVLLRRRPDGLLEVTRVGHLRRAGIALGGMLMSVLVVLAVVFGRGRRHLVAKVGSLRHSPCLNRVE